MTDEELQKIIDQFDEDDLKQRGIFGILQYGGGSDESFIRANKEGLELFALELLKSARETKKILAEQEIKAIPLDIDEDWIDENSTTFLQYIEPIADKQKSNSRDKKQTFVDKLLPYGCGLTLIIIAFLIVVGLVTIIKWIS